MRLNADLLRRRRRELGISERDLAASAGVSKMFIRHLESGGGDDQVTLAVLRRLGRALAASVSDLMYDPGAEPNVDDVAALGAMLTELAEPSSPKGLASVLCWSLDRTHTALSGLECAAPRAGLAVQRMHGLISLRRSAAHLDPEQLRRAHAGVMARRGLDLHAARMLYVVFADQLGDKRRLNVREKQALVQLRNAGIVDESAPETHLGRQSLVVSTEVAYSLRPS